jgi:hypothetical protein
MSDSETRKGATPKGERPKFQAFRLSYPYDEDAVSPCQQRSLQTPAVTVSRRENPTCFRRTSDAALFRHPHKQTMQQSVEQRAQTVALDEAAKRGTFSRH